MKKIIYTVGYTSFPIDEFIRVLRERGIGCLIDVRSTPRSSYYTDFDAPLLKETLRENGILYRNYAREFGARQEDPSLYPNGYLDFENSPRRRHSKRGSQRSMQASAAATPSP